MTHFFDRLKLFFGYGNSTDGTVPPQDPLDYDQAIPLDAERLAEQGILSAYNELSAQLEQYAPSHLEVTEENNEFRYSIFAGGQQYVIWEMNDGIQNPDAWERATVAFFKIVNARLDGSSNRFYALNGGNDLFGIFLTKEEFAAARHAIQKRADWPWMPDSMLPPYGFPVEDPV